jgi:GTP-binding protein
MASRHSWCCGRNPRRGKPDGRRRVNIKSVEFAGAIASPGGSMPGALPQVAFAGRSNVGKSSLINRLLGRTRTRVARVSAQPGKTREINFFRVLAGRKSGDVEFFLVDLPGYGYARVPGHLRDAWRPLIESYLEDNTWLRGVVQLIDARHGPTEDDLRMMTFLAHLGTPALFVLTKVDKLSRSQRAARLPELARALAQDEEQILPFSAQTGEGRETLLEALETLLGGDEERP